MFLQSKSGHALVSFFHSLFAFFCWPLLFSTSLETVWQIYLNTVMHVWKEVNVAPVKLKIYT